ncbi:MAG TPA: histidine phosphatase family protein [Propionibacteriaceae bacterium]|nr:histidine phosphatase family protein [Propionibacteriaceae bacterium]
MQFLIIRHGQSANNHIFETTGSWEGRVPDPHLTDKGLKQAGRLAAHLAGGHQPRPTALHTSLMRRAIQTAAPIADALSLPLQGHAELFEYGGPYEDHIDDGRQHRGTGASALKALSPHLTLPACADEFGWYDGPMERDADCAARASRVAAEMVRRYRDSDEVVALVCHQWFGQYLLRELAGLGPGVNSSWFILNNTSTTAITHGSNTWGDAARIDWVNRFDHLDASLITT